MKRFLAVLLLLAAPAQAASPELTAAIDAFFSGDYSRMAVIEREAAAKDREALYALGMARLYGRGTLRAPATGVTLLGESGNRGYRPAAVQLGMVYRGGTNGIAANEVVAAQWFAHAYRLGDSGALDALRRLSADAVRRAGAADLLAPSTGPASGSVSALVAPKPAAPERGDVSRLAGASPTRAEPTGPVPEISGARRIPVEIAPMDDATRKPLFQRAYDLPAGAFRLADGRSLPFMVDSAADDRFDMLATCRAVLARERLSSAGLGGFLSIMSPNALAENDAEVEDARQLVAAAVRRMESVADETGLGRGERVHITYLHEVALGFRREAAPGAADCRVLTQLL